MEGAASAISVSDFQSVLTTLQGQINVETIVGVLVAAIGAAAVFAFMWWGIRKLISVVMKAVKSGRLGA